MTTNQTIDGVPRELLDWIFECNVRQFFMERHDKLKELRALLDEPAAPVAPCAIADALESAQWPNTSIGNKVLVAAAITELRKAAQPQGEPVAWIGCKHKLPDEGEHVLVKYATIEGLEIVHGAKRHKLFDNMDHLFWVNDRGESMRGEVAAWIPMSRLLGIPAEQPAPVAVVLPERRAAIDSEDPALLMAVATWNACLDEVTRLNATATIPEKLEMRDGLHTYEYVTGHNAAIDKMPGIK